MSTGWSLGKGEQTYAFHEFRIRMTQEGGQPLVRFTEFWWEAGNQHHRVCSNTGGVLRTATRAFGGVGVPQGRIRIGLTARRGEDSRPGGNRGAVMDSCPRG